MLQNGVVRVHVYVCVEGVCGWVGNLVVHLNGAGEGGSSFQDNQELC